MHGPWIAHTAQRENTNVSMLVCMREYVCACAISKAEITNFISHEYINFNYRLET